MSCCCEQENETVRRSGRGVGGDTINLQVRRMVYRYSIIIPVYWWWCVYVVPDLDRYTSTGTAVSDKKQEGAAGGKKTGARSERGGAGAANYQLLVRLKEQERTNGLD